MIAKYTCHNAKLFTSVSSMGLHRKYTLWLCPFKQLKSLFCNDRVYVLSRVNISCIKISVSDIFAVCLSSLAFVPKCNPASMEDVTRLKEFIDKHQHLCALTGAGISTESGIPDYRSAEVGLYARSNRRPILYKEFCDSEATRRRYWARNYIGWPRSVFF